MKNIQISEQLFFSLIKYHLVDMESELPEIKKGLMDKMDSMVMRELYSKYKTAPTEEEKEKARLEYLDKRGVPDSFRW
ncbi:MAG: complexin-2 [Lachnospiraceae bacterium]|nr:complexin-2 [Lachnospiraceae bacterium]